METKTIATKEDIVEWGWENHSSIDLKGTRIIEAYYNRSYYEGDAYVLFSRKGKLYQVASAHCSCNGLYWDEEETTFDELRKRFDESEFTADQWKKIKRYRLLRKK